MSKIYRSIARDWSPGESSAMEQFCISGRFFTPAAKEMLIEEAMLAKAYADNMGWAAESENLEDLIDYTKTAPVYDLH